MRQRRSRTERYKADQQGHADIAFWRCRNCEKKAEKTTDEVSRARLLEKVKLERTKCFRCSALRPENQALSAAYHEAYYARERAEIEETGCHVLPDLEKKKRKRGGVKHANKKKKKSKCGAGRGRRSGRPCREETMGFVTRGGEGRGIGPRRNAAPYPASLAAVYLVALLMITGVTPVWGADTIPAPGRSSMMMSGVFGLMGCLAWKIMDVAVDAASAVMWQLVELSDECTFAARTMIKDTVISLSAQWAELCREVRLGVTVLWWVLVVCLVIGLGRRYGITTKGFGPRGDGGRGLIPAPAPRAGPAVSAAVATEIPQAHMDQVRAIINQYNEPAHFPQKSSSSTRRGLAKCKFCGEDPPDHLGRHCSQNPNRVTGEPYYPPGVYSFPGTRATARSDGAELLSVSGSRAIKEWMTQDQLATFVRKYPESVEMYQKSGNYVKEHMKVTTSESNFKVPGQTGNRNWTVTMAPNMLILQDVNKLEWKCTCPDHSNAGAGCKHVGVVAQVLREDGFHSAIKRKISEYEAAMRTAKMTKGTSRKNTTDPAPASVTPLPRHGRSPSRNQEMMNPGRNLESELERAQETEEARGGGDRATDPSPGPRAVSGSASRRSMSESAVRFEVKDDTKTINDLSPVSSDASPAPNSTTLKQWQEGYFPSSLLMNATETHKIVEYLLLWIIKMRDVKASIWWLAFTFDRQDIVDALIACKRAGHQIRFGADYNQTVGGRTRDQIGCLSRLNANGVEVNLIRGYPLGPVYQTEGRQMFGNLQGIQHCKSFYAEISKKDTVFKFFVIGSANWTLSSRCNCEMSLFLDITDEPQQSVRVKEMMEDYMNRGQPFTSDKATASMRARSASPVVGRTQRKFQENQKKKELPSESSN